MECQQGSLPQVGVTWWNFTYIKVTSWQSCGHFVMISRCFHYFQSCKAPQNNRVKKTAAYNFRLQSSITKRSASKFHPKAPKLLSWILPHLRFSSQAISITFCSNFPCKKKAGGWVAKSWNDFYTVCRKSLWSEAFSNQQTAFFSRPQKNSPWCFFPRIQG